jgi:hypothetical protein
LFLLPSWVSFVHFFPLSFFFFLFVRLHFYSLPLFLLSKTFKQYPPQMLVRILFEKGIYHFLSKRFATSSSPNHRLLPVIRRYTLSELMLY